MRVQDLQARLRDLSPAPLDPHYLALRAAADELLREFVALADWDHLAAIRYRLRRAEAPDFATEDDECG